MSVVGRTWGVGPGPQDRTAGTEFVVVLVREDVVVDTRSVVCEVLGADDFVGGEDFEPRANPMAVPTPRATRTSATAPSANNGTPSHCDDSRIPIRH